MTELSEIERLATEFLDADKLVADYQTHVGISNDAMRHMNIDHDILLGLLDDAITAKMAARRAMLDALGNTSDATVNPPTEQDT